MSIGDGIFLSAVLLSIVGLYAATKDRWSWKRIAKWGLILPVAVLAILALGVWLYSVYDERPIAQESFEGLKLSSTPADVRFLKGEPIAKYSTGDQWVYDAYSGSAQPEDAVVIVRFRNGKGRTFTIGQMSVRLLTHTFSALPSAQITTRSSRNLGNQVIFPHQLTV